ncbi:MAG: tRNA(Ile)-lysidine synthetase [Nocardioidaceae bacterium]|nr:tRNA(Ile)-lysidine synthetase [Nocardioidaceae bacterium]
MLADLEPGVTVLVACSGGADSLALLAATVVEAREGAQRVVGVTVDHGLQEGSAARAAAVVVQMDGLGVDESVTATVQVTAVGLGPEAAAREARYAVLGELAERLEAAVVLLGHTLDDQAETVMLGLTRGSGARSLAGMRRSFEVYRRPLLDVTRADTETACLAEDIAFWTDPHNSDERFTRVRVRTTVLPMLEEELGPGVARSLARTADQLREDTAFLDAVADVALGHAAVPGGLSVEVVGALDIAVRRRVLRLAVVAAGSPSSELFHEHVVAVDRLLTHWHGQTGVDLPGHLRAVRADGVLRFEPNAVSAAG